MKIEDKLEQATQAVRKCLEEVAFLKIEGIESPEQAGIQQPDLLVRIHTLTGNLLLLVAIGRNGEPKEARNAILRLLAYQRQHPLSYGVFVAPYITPSTGNLCMESGIGYIDFAGNCRLSFGQVYIRKETGQNPSLERRTLRSLYSPKAERVLRVLLPPPPFSNQPPSPNRSWRMQALAEVAQVSLGQVANVKELLEDKEWIQEDREGFSLSEPVALLKEWAANYKHRQQTYEMYSMKPPTEIEKNIAHFCDERNVRCAVTGLAAASVYLLSRFVRTSIYIGSDESFLDKLARATGLHQVTSGANVTLIIPDDEGVLVDNYKSVEGIWFASAIQVYLDLSTQQGRAKETAGYLLDAVIEPYWRSLGHNGE